MMHDLQSVPLELLARTLYHLTFPRRDFNKLPESVQAAYRTDAARIKKVLIEGGYVADDRETSDNQSGRG